MKSVRDIHDAITLGLRNLGTNVFGVYDSYGNGVRETAKTEELGTFIVQECSPDYNAYQWDIFY